jgi:hypothetical protein
MSIFRTTLALFLMTAAAAHAAPLFTTTTESTWSVRSGKDDVAKVTVISDGARVRAEWKARSGENVTLVGIDNKLWVKATGGDVAFASWKGGATEKAILPALLLPIVTSTSDKVALKSGKVSTYAYGASTATYTFDATGPSSIAVTSGGKSWTVARAASTKPAKLDAMLFEVRPKQGMSGRLARAAGGLLGPSDSSVSATAGGRGVEKGAKFADGGDYEALEKLEARDEEWQETLPSTLAKFQKEGKVGEAQETRQ